MNRRSTQMVADFWFMNRRSMRIFAECLFMGPQIDADDADFLENPRIQMRCSQNACFWTADQRRILVYEPLINADFRRMLVYGTQIDADRRRFFGKSAVSEGICVQRDQTYGTQINADFRRCWFMNRRSTRIFADFLFMGRRSTQIDADFLENLRFQREFASNRSTQAKMNFRWGL